MPNVDKKPTLAPLTEAALTFEGYQATEALLMLLEGDLTANSKQCDIRKVTSNADWSEYAELHRMAYVDGQPRAYCTFWKGSH